MASKIILTKLLCSISSSGFVFGNKVSPKHFTFSAAVSNSLISASYSELSHKFEISSKFSISSRPLPCSAFNVYSISVSTLSKLR